MTAQELPVKIHVATPCRARWEEMRGDDRARFCAHCSKNVYNLSAMAPAEAAQLVREKEGKLCVRFYRRTDGTLLHAEDCPVGLARHLRRVKMLAGAGLSLAMMLLGINPARAKDGQDAPKNAPISTLPGYSGPTMGIPIPVPAPPPVPTPIPVPIPVPTPTLPNPK